MNDVRQWGKLKTGKGIRQECGSISSAWSHAEPWSLNGTTEIMSIWGKGTRFWTPLISYWLWFSPGIGSAAGLLVKVALFWSRWLFFGQEQFCEEGSSCELAARAWGAPRVTTVHHMCGTPELNQEMWCYLTHSLQHRATNQTVVSSCLQVTYVNLKIYLKAKMVKSRKVSDLPAPTVVFSRV